MTSEIRFGWISESRRLALHALLNAEFMDWSRDWWVHHSSAEVEARSIDPHDLTEKSALPFVSSSDAGVIALYMGGRDIQAIGCYLAGTTAEDDGGIAKRLGVDALDDLAARIRRRAGSAGTNEFSRTELPMGMADVRLGTYAVRLTLGRMEMALIIDRHLADRLAPPATNRGGALVPRQAVLGHVPVSLTTVMDFGSIKLTHLSDLRLGEVLVSERGLDERIEIRVAGGVAIAMGYLKKNGSQHAVTFDGINLQGRVSDE